MERMHLLVLIFALPFAAPAIQFSDGFWNTSFDCPPADARYGYVCDGLGIDDSGYPDDDCNGRYSSVSGESNMAAGAGGNGLGVRMATDRNSMTSGARIDFPSPLKEFWLRFYYRIPEGQSIAGIREHKIIYAFTDDIVAADVNWPGYDHVELQPRNAMGSPDIYYTGTGTGHSTNGGPGGGWTTIYGEAAADGSWHAFEFHLDLGDQGAGNGRFDMWLDGINYVHDQGLDWFTDHNPSGWTHINLPSNHNVWSLDGCPMHAIDDIAIALPAYGNFVRDQGGRPMIGKMEARCLQGEIEPCDGLISSEELLRSIRQWRDGSMTISTLISVIIGWKNVPIER